MHFFCLLHPVSPSAFIVAGTNLFADTRLILQAQLPNANPPRMYLEFVQGWGGHCLNSSHTTPPSPSLCSRATKVLISIAPHIGWKIIICTDMQEQVHFRFDPPSQCVPWIQMVMQWYIVQGKFGSMLTLPAPRILTIRWQGFVNLIQVKCSKVDCLLHRVT